MRHEWKDGEGVQWGADDELGALVNGEPCDPQACDSWPDEILRLAERVRQHEAHEAGIRQTLRIECEELGDNDWPDDLHLGDVIERHLADPAAARIQELEKRERKLREALKRIALHLEGYRHLLTAEEREDIEYVRALLKDESPVKAGAAHEDWPPEGWRVHNPDWPAGDGPHLVPED